MKKWLIVATITAAVLIVGTTVLITLMVVTNSKTEPNQAEITAETDGDDVTLMKIDEVDIKGLDGSKLVTLDDLTAQDIPGETPDHYIGNKNSKVVVIEYEDFACSHCQALHKDAEQIHADYKDRVLFIHRSFSLDFPNSDRTLYAAEAAYEVGGEKAYWAMSNLLYQDTRWTGAEVFGGQGILNGYAKKLGLDVSKFKTAMSNANAAYKVARDKELGVKADVAGTPTWIINGQSVTPRDADLRAALDAALL